MFVVEPWRISGILAPSVSDDATATNFRVRCSPGYAQSFELPLTPRKVVCVFPFRECVASR